MPFYEVGTGTVNALMLAMLSFIADIKKDNVIFAMEEPEIALSPHTQRRIVNYLLGSSNQCFVSSHSPYIIERFDPASIRILRKDNRRKPAGLTMTRTNLSAVDRASAKIVLRQLSGAAIHSRGSAS